MKTLFGNIKYIKELKEIPFPKAQKAVNLTS
jgi:hypothetical protein